MVEKKGSSVARVVYMCLTGGDTVVPWGKLEAVGGEEGIRKELRGGTE